jgi:ADP-heptose:LPS heptosyltransferase
MKLWLDKGVWTRKQAKQKADKLDFKNIRSIGVIKHAALGDLMATRPFLITLKEFFPDAKITLGLSSNYTRGAPVELVDNIHVTNAANNKVSLKQQIKNYKEFGYHDIIFDLTATTRSFMLCFLNKAGLKIGYIHRNIHKLLYDVAVYRTVFKYEGETFLDQLATLGLDYQWPLNFGLPKHDAIYNEPYIVIFPTASTPNRCWPVQHFAELITKMTSSIKSHKIVLLTGISDWEKNIANEIIQSVKNSDNVILFEGIKQTENSVADKEEACIANADLVICNDTGIRNMAIAYHTPTVGLFMTSLPFRYYPRFGKHAVVFDVSGQPPSTDKAFSAVLNVINSEE